MFAKNLHHRLHGSLEERKEAQQKSWEDQLRSILAGVQEGGATPTPRGAAVTQGGDAPGVLQVTCLLQEYRYGFIIIIIFLYSIWRGCRMGVPHPPQRDAAVTPRGAAVTPGGDAPGMLQVTCLLQEYCFVVVFLENISIGRGAGGGCHTHPSGCRGHTRG